MDYATQFRKIENAYNECKLTIDDDSSNFVGTLLNNNPDWAMVIQMPMDEQSLNKGLHAIATESNNFYQIKDIFALDRKWRAYWDYLLAKGVPYEEALHKTLFVTMKLLNEIHVRKGQLTHYIFLEKRKDKKSMKIIFPVTLPLFNLDAILHQDLHTPDPVTYLCQLSARIPMVCSL